MLLQTWIMFGVTRGLSHDELCAASGFRPADIADRDRHVPRAWFVALRLAVIERLPGVDVGIELGKLLSLAQFGYFGLALQQCETLRDGLHFALRYVSFVLGPDNDSFPRIEDNGDTVDWVFPPSIDYPAESIESHFIHVVETIRALGDSHVNPRRVCFAYPREPLRERLQAIFAAPVEFSSADSRIEFECVDVARPNPRANTEARKHLAAELDKRIQRLGQPFVALVTRVIELQLSSCQVSQSATAKRLGIGTRTLQRKLTEHGVTYQGLVDQVRRSLGEQLLRNPSLAVHQVAFALGYRDAGGFNRAWRQWTGVSPRAFRNQADAAR